MVILYIQKMKELGLLRGYSDNLMIFSGNKHTTILFTGSSSLYIYDYWDWEDIRECRYYDEDYIRRIASNVCHEMMTVGTNLEQYDYDQLVDLLQGYDRQSLALRQKCQSVDKLYHWS